MYNKKKVALLVQLGVGWRNFPFHSTYKMTWKVGLAHIMNMNVDDDELDECIKSFEHRQTENVCETTTQPDQL